MSHFARLKNDFLISGARVGWTRLLGAIVLE